MNNVSNTRNKKTLVTRTSGIPESIRKKFELKAGDQFVVVGQGDVVMLKVITLPCLDEYEGLKKQLRNQARDAGLKYPTLNKRAIF